MRSKTMMFEEQFAMNRHLPQLQSLQNSSSGANTPSPQEANGFSHAPMYSDDVRWKMKKNGVAKTPKLHKSTKSHKVAKSQKAQKSKSSHKAHKRKMSQEEKDFYNSQDTQSALHALKKLRNDTYHAYANGSPQMNFAQQTMMVNAPGVMYYGRN